MRNTLLVVLIAAFLPASALSAKKETVKCQKQAVPMKIDGRVAAKTQWLTEKKGEFYYHLSNDKNNLYIQLKFENPDVVRKVVAFGLTVWIDPNAKGKNELGIQYPEGRIKKMREKRSGSQGMTSGQNYSNRNQMRAENMNPAQQRRSQLERIERLNKMFIVNNFNGELKGFDKNGLHDRYFGRGDIHALVQMNEKGGLVYEAVIPLKSIFKNPEKYLKKQTPFSLVFETGYFERDMTHMRPGGMRNGRMPGGSAPVGMRRNYSRGGQQLQGMQVPAKIKLKKVILNND
jgi:hypothetical protein